MANSKRLGVIFARGSSKRLPRKNLYPLLGTPLLAWTSLAALKSLAFTRIIVSTEDQEIADFAKAIGMEVPFKRPGVLAEDFANDIDILLHGLTESEKYYSEKYDSVALIQPTTPFIGPNDFRACFEKLESENLGCVFTARKVQDHPRWIWENVGNYRVEPYLKTKITPVEQHAQNLKSLYFPSGAVWVMNVEKLKLQNTIYCTPTGIIETPWQQSIDIDYLEDLIVAEAVGKHYGFTPP